MLGARVLERWRILHGIVEKVPTAQIQIADNTEKASEMTCHHDLDAAPARLQASRLKTRLLHNVSHQSAVLCKPAQLTAAAPKAYELPRPAMLRSR